MRYFTLILTTVTEPYLISQWIPQVRYHTPKGRIILLGRIRLNPTNPSLFRQEDGIKLAQIIGAVAYVELYREAVLDPYNDASVTELADVMAWAARTALPLNSQR